MWSESAGPTMLTTGRRQLAGQVRPSAKDRGRLSRHAAPFIPLTIAKRGKEIDYEAKAVMLAGRYIVCAKR